MIATYEQALELSNKKWPANKVFIGSDFHFFHPMIIEYSNRPWRLPSGAPDVDGMTKGLIKSWNEVVPPDGETFIVGDVAMGGKSRANELCAVLDALNGNKYLIPGNHDTYILEEPCVDHITVLPPIFNLRVKDSDGVQKIMLCHYAMRVWEGSHKKNWALYGHSHGSLPTDYKIKSFDVGVDAGHGYGPLSFQRIKKIMEKHNCESVDHHNNKTMDNSGY